MNHNPFKTISEVNEYLSGDKIQCLLCSKWFVLLESHITQKHGIDLKDYKTKFNIPLNYGLATQKYKQNRAKAARNAPWRDKFLKGSIVYNESIKGTKIGKRTHIAELTRLTQVSNFKKAQETLKEKNRKIIVNCSVCGEEIVRSELSLKTVKSKGLKPSCHNCAALKWWRAKYKKDLICQQNIK